MTPLTFKEKILKIGSFVIVRIPKSVSKKLPSRGIVMVEGTINGYHFQRELEPDGAGSHWLQLNKAMLTGAKAGLGNTLKIVFEPSKEWPEPQLPDDLKKALEDSPKAKSVWMDITPLARWDWIRWIRSTKNPETRKIRIAKTFSKFESGLRRPCCFNRTECTIPEVSDKGVLLQLSDKNVL